MNLNLDVDVIRRLAQQQVREIARQALPIFEQQVAGRFPLTLDGATIVAPQEGLTAEYGTADLPGEPWVFPGFVEFARGHQ